VFTRRAALTDFGRPDPFASRPGPRKLMVQPWYPTGAPAPAPHPRNPAVPYTDPGTAAALEADWGMRPGVLKGVGTHARAEGRPAPGAPPPSGSPTAAWCSVPSRPNRTTGTPRTGWRPPCAGGSTARCWTPPAPATPSSGSSGGGGVNRLGARVQEHGSGA